MISDIIGSANENKLEGKELVETSLRTYLRYLYFDPPENVTVSLNGDEVDLRNPYSELKRKYPTVFIGERHESFAAQVLNQETLKSLITADI